MISSEEFVSKFNVSFAGFLLVEVIHVQLSEGGGTWRMNEDRLACLK